MVLLSILAARLHRSRWPLYAEPALAFIPVSLFFLAYDERLFGQPLTSAQYGIVWAGLGMLHLLAAALLDARLTGYAHGLFLGGYALSTIAVLYTLLNPAELVWTLGLFTLAAIGSVLLVHFERHRTWEALLRLFLGDQQDPLRAIVRSAFLWLAALTFPFWCTLLLSNLKIVKEFTWLGSGLAALAFLGLAAWLKRIEPVYAWPLHSAAQLYTLLGVMTTLPLTTYRLGNAFPPTAIMRLPVLGVIAVQALAVIFYIAAARSLRWPGFAHIAAWLSFFPYTLAWIVFAPYRPAVHFALPWMGWAALLLVVGFLLDRADANVRHAHGPYLAGYVLAGFALWWSTPDRLVNLYALGSCILLAILSQALIHFGQHRSFDDLVSLIFPVPGSIPYRAMRAAFLFFAAYAFPAWLVQLLIYQDVPPTWRGLALALLAPLYIGLGLALRRSRGEYTWPLYSAGYALTAAAVPLAFNDLKLFIYVLALNTLVYAVSAFIFRQPFWFYLSNLLLPIVVVLTLQYNHLLDDRWVAGTLMGLSFAYFGIGRLFDTRGQSAYPPKKAKAFAMPFYIFGYLLSAVALAASTGEKILAIYIFSAGVILYALSAWAFRKVRFLYPATWLAVVPYYLLMTMTTLPPPWYGLGRLPLILVLILLGRAFFHRRPIGPLRGALGHPAMPFYLLAYFLSISMLIYSRSEPLPFTLAFAAGALLYFGSALLFRHPAWLYPTLLSAHMALLVYFTIAPSGSPAYYISLPFLGLTWVEALIGYWVGRSFTTAQQAEPGRWIFKLGHWELDFGRLPSFGYLIAPTWAQPIFIFTLLDILVWQGVALGGYDTAVIVASGYAVLLGLLAVLWLDGGLTYAALAFFLLAVGARLKWLGLPFAEGVAWFGGFGLGLYLVERLLAPLSEGRPRLELWSRPLVRTAVALTTLAIPLTLFTIVRHPVAAAAALACAGALYVALAYRRRHLSLGYLGMALLEIAWVLALVVRQVQQPQWYAIPTGLYFTIVGLLERRRGRPVYAALLEAFGLAVMLITSFIQSLNGAQGFPYFLLLLVEGLLVIWWGAARRVRLPFFSGLAASVLNVVAQIVVRIQVYEVSRWVIILGVGLALVTIAIFVERQRERILAQAKIWRDQLETWD